MGGVFSSKNNAEPARPATSSAARQTPFARTDTFHGVPPVTSRAPSTYSQTFDARSGGPSTQMVHLITNHRPSDDTRRAAATVRPTPAVPALPPASYVQTAPKITTHRYASGYCCDYCDSNYDNEDDDDSKDDHEYTHSSHTQTVARRGHHNVDSLVDAFSHLSLTDAKDTGYTPIYTLSVGHKRVCLFEPGREKFIEAKREMLSISNPEEGQIYHVSSISRDSIEDLIIPSNVHRKQLTDRPSFVYSTPELYRQLVLPALLLGSRVRDFEQRCAKVVQLGELILDMPSQHNRRLKGKQLKLRTISGQVFEVKVKFVNSNDADKRWIVECETPTEPLPRKVRQGALLEIMGGWDAQPRVTGALMRYYAGTRFDFSNSKKANYQKNQKKPEYKPAEIGNWELLSCIYGDAAKKVYPAVDPSSPLIQLAKNAGHVQLNPEQAEAVARYKCTTCPGFVVESPPGSGKTMTAAAMAVSYKGEGVQLFLSTANVPVINMALAMAKLDYGFLKAIHLISSEREDLMTGETRSPFSVLSLAKENEKLKVAIEALEREMEHAPNDEEKAKIKGAIDKACGPIFNDSYDIYFATVDMILGRLYKPNQGGKHHVDNIKKQLVNTVKRIVVDEASQLTESALNALILCFPNAQIVLIGDSKQMPPFRYTPKEVVSELAARPALDVFKDKINLPVIKLSRVYRASPSMMKHYSDCFYKGELRSFKAESAMNPFSCFGARSGGSKRLFWKVDKGIAKKQGTSKYNFGELKNLRYIVNMLKNSGYKEKDVMIISYYEAQRKKAEDELKELGDYELLTVDSAQGREKEVVIVLTTRTSVPSDAGAFFNCALRCNVAVSRHQEALIVLGHPSIASAPNWARVLDQKYFKHVEDSKGWKFPVKQ